ncbi:hypothetical protein DM860_009672 [Cuscuta australis]|uniref:Replication factor A C-terminal domain-containing protein n=1 Tax=Cuscuta australis TaxID=267555 RepID=A0A328DME4_9ASTE|nr:hypothetical protein DM860_009672 [Cuscuta australis]
MRSEKYLKNGEGEEDEREKHSAAAAPRECGGDLSGLDFWRMRRFTDTERASAQLISFGCSTTQRLAEEGTDTMGILTDVGKQKEIVTESKRTKMIVIQLEADGVNGVSSQHQPLKLPCDDITVVEQNEFLDSKQTTTISLLKDSSEDGTYVVYATIVSVNNSGDWFYLACKCNRAVRADGTMYYCMHCVCRVMNVTPRYLIKLSVKDDSGTTNFVLFDHEASSILNMSCSLLLEKTNGIRSYRELEDDGGKLEKRKTCADRGRDGEDELLQLPKKMRLCKKTSSLISDAIGVSYPIVDGVPHLVPADGQIVQTNDASDPGGVDSSGFKSGN